MLLLAPAQIHPSDLRRSPNDLGPRDWFWWMHTMKLFSRMGVMQKVAPLLQQAYELKSMLEKGDGFFPVKPHDCCFKAWSVYSGLALDDSWKNDRWKHDTTFRSLLILKYAGLL